jgi:hypothetical protein
VNRFWHEVGRASQAAHGTTILNYLEMGGQKLQQRGGWFNGKPAPTSVKAQQQIVVSIILGLAATAFLLWITNYSWIGIAAVALLWLAAEAGRRSLPSGVRRRSVPSSGIITDSSKTSLRFGQGMSQSYVFFLPIWLMAVMHPLPFARQYRHVSGVLFCITGLLATLPYLGKRVTMLTWWLFGVLVPVAALWLETAAVKWLNP